MFVALLYLTGEEGKLVVRSAGEFGDFVGSLVEDLPGNYVSSPTMRRP